jgi:hypothetical protein
MFILVFKNIIMKNRLSIIIIFSSIILFNSVHKVNGQSLFPLAISENHHHFTDGSGKPFFWLGDTGWLLFSKLTREEAIKYLDDRAQKGFNVIQVMMAHSLSDTTVYGDYAFIGEDVTHPLLTHGNSFDNPKEYDFWDHVDFLIDQAGKRGIYMALVPVWGSIVKAGKVNSGQAEIYAEFLAQRYKNKTNIIWVNGGDIRGSDSLSVWNTIGKTLRSNDSNHLITFHPFGRTQSSAWFQNEDWLDFNMFQSGHRRYDQDDSEHAYGEDNWRYVESDYRLLPVKPVLDGEPSYEGIPQGLHDTLQPRWNDNDIRRYAYWSVFSGACGHTYGNNSVMQFYKPSDKTPAYGAKEYWTEAINAPGANQMIFLKKLMLSRPYFDRVPDQSIIAGAQGEKYDYLIATRAINYAFIYTFTGKNFLINTGKIKGEKVKASWYNPRDGSTEIIGTFSNSGVLEFDPPGVPQNGNDHVLILDSVE